MVARVRFRRTSSPNWRSDYEAAGVDLSLTEEQEMLRDGVRRFVREQYEFEARRKLAAGELGFEPQHWQTFAELGWLALTVPESAGGLGCSAVETALIMEGFGAGLVLEPYASNAVLAVRILEGALTGGSQLAGEVLASLAEGKTRVALAHSEAAARYDLAAVETTARRDGTGYRLSGVKTLALDAPSADKLIVSARVDTGAIGLFLVDRATPGLVFDAYRLLDDTRAADVVLRDVPVASAAVLLADEGRALEVLEEALDRLILARVAESLGAMEAVLEISSEYVKSRVQFGQPLGKFQATQHRLAEMFVEVQETRSILYCGLAHIEATAAARRRAISAAKVVAASAGRIVGGLGIQLHGGIGVTEEYRVGHYFKKLVVTEKLLGDTDHHLRRLRGAF
jgi:alkylation response protein AidB-like acyl-CoA dehydrogenase